MAAMESAYNKWRRKTYVLYRFQSYYALVVVAFSMLLTLTTSLVVYRLFRGTGATESAMEFLASDPRAAAASLGMLLLLICAFFAFYLILIVASHRIAGPLSVISRHLAEIQEGHYPQMRDLRAEDELKEFFATFRTTVDRLRARQIEEVERLQEAIEGLSGSGTRSQQAVSTLKAMLEAKSRALGQSPVALPQAERILPTGTGRA